MNGELFQRIVAQIEQIDKSKPSVHLQGWGEPLLHPATMSHIGQLKSAGVTVSFTRPAGGFCLWVYRRWWCRMSFIKSSSSCSSSFCK